MKEKLKLSLQFFANVSDIMTEHKDAFPEGNDFEARFGAVQTELQNLGYDLLVNHRQKAEFVPSSRLSEVISQRDSFKTQLDKASKELEGIKSQSGISEEAQKQIDDLISSNTALLENLRDANINLGVVTEFGDAIDANDILHFIDKSKLKIDKDGKITGGLKEEHDRLRNEKPHLFKVAEGAPGKQAGKDPQGGSGHEKASMNTLIRRASFGIKI